MRVISFRKSALSLGITAAFMWLSVVYLKCSPHGALIVGCMAASVVALRHGYYWEELLEFMVKGITRSIESIMILMLIGVLIGVWIIAGVIPTMMVYGLRLISPQWILVSIVLVSALVSLVLGSWGTAGTVGVAFTGAAEAIGISPAMAARAVISGAYVGDKFSPITDTTHLDSAVTDVDIFQNTRYMIRIGLPFFLLSLFVYGIFGFWYSMRLETENLVEMNKVADYLEYEFFISPVSLFPLAFILICILLKIPALPSICIGIIVAAVYGVVAQKTAVRDLFTVIYDGYSSKSGIEIIDSLLNTGGVGGMMYSISVILLAMMFGGVMEYTGQMKQLLTPVIKKVRCGVELVFAVICTCV